MVLVAVRDAPNQISRPLLVSGAARAVLLAGAGMEDDAVLPDRQALGVELGKPGRRGGGRCGEVQVHAGLAHQAHVLVPDLPGPLLRVVVAAVDHVRDLPGDHGLTSCACVATWGSLGPDDFRLPKVTPRQ